MVKAYYSRWIEIDLDAIVYNFQQIKKVVPSNVKIQAVVKSDAYGHGAIPVARVLEKAGVDMLAVTTMEEGMELVVNGVNTPILVLAPLLPFQAVEMVRSGLLPTIDSPAALAAYAKAAQEKGVKGCFHLKIETGMGRAGVGPDELVSFLECLKGFPDVEMTGIYSHLATAMLSDKKHARKQFHHFLQALEIVRQEGLETLVAHIANSAAVLDLPEMHLDMVRVGTLLYGQYPSKQVRKKLTLKDPWKVKALVSSVKHIFPGSGVGYGRDFIATKPMQVGVVPIGYADGFGMVPQTRPVKPYDFLKSVARLLANLLGLLPVNYVVWEQERIPVIGRVGMQLCMVDITNRDIKLGDEVQIPMRRTTAASRLPRVFFKDGQVFTIRGLVNYF